VAQSYVDEATLIMSGGMLAFTVAYLLTRPERAVSEPQPGDVAQVSGVLDWRLLALACAPLAVLTYEGRGYNGTAATAPGAALGPELASAFFVLLMALAAFSLVLRRGPQWFLPALAAQSVLLAAAGERTPVIADAIVLIVLLARAGMRPSGTQLRAAAGLTLATVLAIGGVRAEQGRSLYGQDSGLGARLAALGDGLSGLGGTAPGDSPGLLAQAASRLDGTAFAGGILQAEHLGQPGLSAAGVPASLLITVPSALWPAKVADSAGLNPVLAETDDFGLQQVNFLPGLAGFYAGFLSWPWLIAFLAVLGLLAGWAERALLRSASAARLVLLAGAVIMALDFEKGLPGMLAGFRAVVLLAVAVRLACAFLRVQRARARLPAAGSAPGLPRPRLP